MSESNSIGSRDGKSRPKNKSNKDSKKKFGGRSNDDRKREGGFKKKKTEGKDGENRGEKREGGRSSGGGNRNGGGRGRRDERSSRDRGDGRRRDSRGRSRGKKKSKKGIDYDLAKLNHVGVPVEETKYIADRPFVDWPIHKKLHASLKKAGFESPTEIQEKTFPIIAEMKDVVGIANTGTGKTGAFLLPLIDALLDGQQFQTLVIVPTRELALQVEQEFKRFTKDMKMHIACFIGGTNLGKDMRTLRRRHHFIVGTPGRLKDLCQRKALKLGTFSTLILDEYDRMLDMGFKPDLDFLLGQMGQRDQTLLFSATVNPEQKNQIQEMMHNPITVQVSSGKHTAEHIDQELIDVREDAKYDHMVDYLHQDEVKKVLIFERTKRRCDKLGKQLRKDKFRVDEIHGDKSQNYRQRALKDFTNGRVDILVATDVAARGLDINDVTHVINYHLPQDYETYIHRIGRTGRAGKKGIAITYKH